MRNTANKWKAIFGLFLLFCLSLVAEKIAPMKYMILQVLLAPDGSTYVLVQETVWPGGNRSTKEIVELKYLHREMSLSPTIMRILPNQTLDTSFGNYEGMHRLELEGYNEINGVRMSLDDQGRLLLAGQAVRYGVFRQPQTESQADEVYQKYFEEGEGRSEILFVARFTQYGILDVFGPQRNGISIVADRPIGAPLQVISNLGNSLDGKIHLVISGYRRGPTNYLEEKLLRFQTLDPNGLPHSAGPNHAVLSPEDPDFLIGLKASRQPGRINFGTIFSYHEGLSEEKSTVGMVGTYHPEEGVSLPMHTVSLGVAPIALAIDEADSFVILGRRQVGNSQYTLLDNLQEQSGTSRCRRPAIIPKDFAVGKGAGDISIVGTATSREVTVTGVSNTGILQVQKYDLETGQSTGVQNVDLVRRIVGSAISCRNHFTQLAE